VRRSRHIKNQVVSSVNYVAHKNLSESEIMQELKHYAHSVAQNTYHFQWTTKYRDDRFRSFYRRRLCEGAIRLAAHNHGIRIVALRVLVDHVHAFVEFPPAMSPSKAMGLLKGISSRIVRRNVPHLAQEKALWSPGKFIRSVGTVTSGAIENYIAKSAKNQYGLQEALADFGLDKARSPAL